MSRSTIGWIWVAGQAVLLGLLIVLPGGDAWPRPGLLLAIASGLFFGGLALMAVAALRLGSGLTPTPVPTQSGQLITTGLFRYMRHPIYTGVFITITGMALRSASWLHVGIVAVTLVFFDRKAAWEEQQLRDRYPGYADYAALTPKFVPGWSGRSLSS